MNKPKRSNQSPRLFTILITTSFILLGSIVGLCFGALLYIYLIPFWHHTKIDVKNHNFNEIAMVGYMVGYDVFNFDDISLDNVILKANDGEYYSYHQNTWQQTRLPTRFDKSNLSYYSAPCSELPAPPPTVYLQKTKNTVGVEFEHNFGAMSRCYVLLADGSLHVWTREYDVFEMIDIGIVSLIIGVVIGGIIGKYVTKRKLLLATTAV
ncbi:MAG: hypothetical protein R3C14_20400 [Caldilineaceae bacterium]